MDKATIFQVLLETLYGMDNEVKNHMAGAVAHSYSACLLSPRPWIPSIAQEEEGEGEEEEEEERKRKKKERGRRRGKKRERRRRNNIGLPEI
jgi:hypothetical protein